jgi:hypothetical protein
VGFVGFVGPAIHQCVKRLRKLTSQVIALEKAGQLVDEKLTASDRLEFQETVIDIIRQENPDAAHRIITRLKERRALRPGAELPMLDGGGPDGSRPSGLGVVQASPPSLL